MRRPSFLRSLQSRPNHPPQLTFSPPSGYRAAPCKPTEFGVANKRRKRMSKKELKEIKAPDKFEVAIKRGWDALNKYRTAIIGSIVLLVGGGIAWSLARSATKAGAETRAEAFRSAMDPFVAPVGEPPKDEKKPPAYAPKEERFADETAAMEAAKKRLAEFRQEYGSDNIDQAAELAEGSVLLRQGKSEEAAKVFEAWLQSNSSSPFKPVAQKRLSEAYANMGKIDKAKATLKELATGSSGLLKALALVALGDLNNPLVVAGADAAQARKDYEAAQELLGAKPEPMGMAMFYEDWSGYRELRSELTSKLDSLP